MQFGEEHQTPNFALERIGAASSVVMALERFAKRHRDAFLWLKRRGIRSIADVGICVGPVVPVSIRFEPEQLRVLERLGVQLEVSAYPVSHD